MRLEATANPTLVVADRQIGGRGRQGREWVEPDRGMYASFALESDWDVSERTLIPLVAAVAIRQAVARLLGVTLGLRWPNDLMVDRRKAGGILVEASGDVVLVGCGVNLWWDSPIDGATAVLDSDPGDGIARDLAESWTDTLIEHLSVGSESWPREEYESASITLGHAVHWDAGQGVAVAIAADGALVVDTDRGRMELRAGEIHTRDDR